MRRRAPVAATPAEVAEVGTIVDNAVGLCRSNGHKLERAFHEIGRAFGFPERRIKSIFFREAGWPISSDTVESFRQGWIAFLRKEERHADSKRRAIRKQLEKAERDLEASAAQDRTARNLSRAVGDDLCVAGSGVVVVLAGVKGGRYGPRLK